ncbi:MAG: HNH endonuclease [Verrucomicrobiaceae bacterium]|nr:HNH endonuclease [Verrucomicrobiaceae bacterium]
MSRLFSTLALWLLLLLAAQPASGVMSVQPRTCTWAEFDPGYDLASDVRNGPNLYAYVRQNPWTAWDPHGLNLVTKLAQKGLKVISHDADGVAKVAGKRASDYMPRGVLPGGTYNLPGDLGKKYPQGVKFDKEGFPDFSPYRQGPDVRIDMTGDSGKDLLAADKKAGVTEAWRKERGLTWHHHQDGETMQLIPSEVNGNTPHIGGAAITRSAKKMAEDAGFMVADLIAPNTTAAYMAGGAGVLGYGKAIAKDVGENLDPGIGMIATKENAEKAGRGFWNAVDGSGNYGDFSHSHKYDTWGAFKESVKGAWDYVTGADLKKDKP